MANVFKVSSSASLTVDDVLDFADTTRTQDITLTANKVVRNRQNINNAAHEALVLGEISGNLGWGWFWNRDSTNYVEIGIDSAGSFVALARIQAGKFSGWIPFPPALVPYAKANTATVDLTYILVTA